MSQTDAKEKMNGEASPADLNKLAGKEKEKMKVKGQPPKAQPPKQASIPTRNICIG